MKIISRRSEFFQAFFFFLMFLFEGPISASQPNIVDGTFLLRSRHELLSNQIKARQPLWQAQRKAFGRISRQMVPGVTVMNFQAYNFSTGQYETAAGTLHAAGT
ncbi:hypothetical protein HYY75_13395, partial [bacterium]|nr:hypothetical protein [bacterium]